MPDVLIKGAVAVLTMDDARHELAGADVLIRSGVIADIGVGLDAGGAEIVLATGCVVTPGLVNTHHHLNQTLTRAVPGGQDALLFGWLVWPLPWCVLFALSYCVACKYREGQAR